MISKENKVYFGIDNIIFTLKDLMILINSKKLKSGSSIIFDEPQVSISSREFQSEANKIFNYLLTTFRHRNLSLFFCTPYEDLLDLSTRKLFHAKLETLSIDINKKKTILKPMTTEYNSHNRKFYQKFLRVVFKEAGDIEYTTHVLKSWGVSKPSEDLIKLYEEKKLNFTKELNKQIQQRLESFDRKQEDKYSIDDKRKPLTNRQEEILIALAKHKGNVKQTALDLKIHERTIYFHQTQAQKKQYKWEELSN